MARLSSYGQVIAMLSSGSKGQMIPFRQSKLTALLKESLGGATNPNFKTTQFFEIRV